MLSFDQHACAIIACNSNQKPSHFPISLTTKPSLQSAAEQPGVQQPQLELSAPLGSQDYLICNRSEDMCAYTAQNDTPQAGLRVRPAAAQELLTLNVEIERHFTSKVYTTGSTIRGQAIAQTLRDTPFDGFDIVFTGVAAIRPGFIQQYTSQSVHRFMTLRMPIPQSSLPDDMIFVSGKTYSIPFNFTVPHQLPLGACTHPCSSLAVREQHLRLPPTVGFWQADDQAPRMIQIEYSIKATAYRRGETGSLMEAHNKVNVLPACPEDPPLDITSGDERYNLLKSKTIYKNFFTTKSGTLTATASQPAAIMLVEDGHRASTTTARICLDFAPVSAEMAPPKVKSISGKITAATFFGAIPTDLLPNLGSRSTTDSAMSYTTTSYLFSNPIDTVAWQQHNLTGRRDSAYANLGVGEDGFEPVSPKSHGRGRGKSKVFKNCPARELAVLEIPFSITSNCKLYLPTFYSCLIARVYTLRLKLHVGPTNSTISLAIPLQIGVRTGYQPLFVSESLTFDSVSEDYDAENVDTHIQSRGFRISEIVRQSNRLLSGFGELSRRSSSST